MNIEIRRPELEQRVREQIASGQFQDVDELLTKALDALRNKDALRSCRAASTKPASGAELLEMVHAASETAAVPKLPTLHLGDLGSLHRRDIYDDVR